MTYQHNPGDPLVLLAATAKSLMDQYDANTITLQQFKDALNSQVVPQFATVDKSSSNDDAYHTISQAVSYVNAIE